MPTPRESLLAGRNQQSLEPDRVRQIANIFMGFDSKIPTRYEGHSITKFNVAIDGTGTEYGEVVFGPDIYPGPSRIDANSSLGVKAVVAHELTHYYRWFNHTELHEAVNKHLDEALTDLEAIERYRDKLDPSDIQELVRDANGRLSLYVEQIMSVYC